MSKNIRSSHARDLFLAASCAAKELNGASLHSSLPTRTIAVHYCHALLVGRIVFPPPHRDGRRLGKTGENGARLDETGGDWDTLLGDTSLYLLPTLFFPFLYLYLLPTLLFPFLSLHFFPTLLFPFLSLSQSMPQSLPLPSTIFLIPSLAFLYPSPLPMYPVFLYLSLPFRPALPSTSPENNVTSITKVFRLCCI